MRDLSRLYNEHFGLTERPFSLLPDPDFLYWATPHRKAYTMLEYGVAAHSPITMITGEIGSGKTTLVRKLLDDMPQDFSVGLISNAQGDRGELLHWVLMSLDLPVEPGLSYVQLFKQFQTFLIEEYAAGRRTALIFDEAQNLSPLALEELRMFSNINADKDQLLQLILVGQPELRDLVRQPILQQFAQRIAAEFHLRALTAEEADEYIQHRLRHAGADREIIDAEARRLIHLAGRGIPRLINQLCDYALVYAFSEDRPVADAALVRDVLEDRRQSGVFAAVTAGGAEAALGLPHPAHGWSEPPAASGGWGEAAPARSRWGAPEGEPTSSHGSSSQDGPRGDPNMFHGVWDRNG
ncbi:ExeA family protein [Albimonas pacifica]|uniref:Type II secretion system protein A n=1 Tax=Albimonas pacifica TaxID=1114924 RepID=A0A1I3C555_9RHOB|nr:AAA family ATPase [Albimonas pacifica]SFH69289.1 type II secretion system protein A [Albimonas pacifica]